MSHSLIGPRGRETSPAARRRLVAVGVALGFHLLILALFLFSHHGATVGAGVGQGVMDLSLAGLSRGASRTPSPVAVPAASAAPIAKTLPPAPPEVIKPRSVFAIVTDILALPLPESSVTPTPLVAAPSPVMLQAMAQAAGSSGVACDIGGAVQSVLRADPEAHGAILLIPTKARSTSNAVMMWDRQWVAPVDVGGEASFDVLRAAIRRVVSAAAPECRDREIVGPRFMLIPENEITLVAVFGDASWRWSDLLSDPDNVATVPTTANPRD